jgi:shikimate kinase
LATDKAAFGALLAEREDLYREVATHTLDNEGGRTAAALAGEVAEWVSAGGASRASRGQASC